MRCGSARATKQKIILSSSGGRRREVGAMAEIVLARIFLRWGCLEDFLPGMVNSVVVVGEKKVDER